MKNTLSTSSPCFITYWRGKKCCTLSLVARDRLQLGTAARKAGFSLNNSSWIWRQMSVCRVLGNMFNTCGLVWKVSVPSSIKKLNMHRHITRCIAEEFWLKWREAVRNIQSYEDNEFPISNIIMQLHCSVCLFCCCLFVCFCFSVKKNSETWVLKAADDFR